MNVTREDIIWAYRLFLDREPESEEIIEEKMGTVQSTAELRAQILASVEFKIRSGALLAPTMESNIVIKEIDGLRLFVDLCDVHVGLNIVNGVYERDELDLIRRIVKPGQTVIDIGANIGFFSIMLGAQVGPAGHVYAFEPLPRNSSLLSRSVAENGFETRVTIERVAVGAAPGSLQLISPDKTNNWGGSYLRIGTASVPAGHSAQFVSVVQLDRYPLRRPISFIKLDAEGAEMLVLRGARTILETDRPVVLAELNPKQLRDVSDCSPNDLIQKMASLGYRCHLLGKGGTQSETTQYDTDIVSNAVFLANT